MYKETVRPNIDEQTKDFASMMRLTTVTVNQDLPSKEQSTSRHGKCTEQAERCSGKISELG